MVWKEMADFSGGLWERGTAALFPDNALAVMDDCHPYVAGGVVPVVATVPIASTHPDAAASVTQMLGYYQSADGQITLCAYSKAPFSFIVSQFTSTAVISTPSGIDPTKGAAQVMFVDSGPAGTPGHRNIAWNVDFGSSGDNGVWVVNSNSLIPGSCAQVLSYSGITALAYHQARLVALQSGNNTTRSGAPVLAYTDPGSDTAWNVLVNFLDLQTSPQSAIAAWGVVYAPSELVVMLDGRGLLDVQGDITAPIVRDVTQQYPSSGATSGSSQIPIPFHYAPVITDEGLVYFSRNRGLMVWAGGSRVDHLSRQINPGNMLQVSPPNSSQLGSIGYAGRFIFLPGQGARAASPAAYVYDTWTKSWHRQTQWANTLFYKAVPGLNYKLYGFGMNYLSPAFDYRSMDLASDPSLGTTAVGTYTFKTHPQSIDARYVELREVELILGAGSSGAQGTLTVTATPVPTGTPVTVTASYVVNAGGEQVIRKIVGLLPAQAFTVQITFATSNAGEAPTCKKLRMGCIPRYRLGVS
jgi:hypothetical protein